MSESHAEARIRMAERTNTAPAKPGQASESHAEARIRMAERTNTAPAKPG